MSSNDSTTAFPANLTTIISHHLTTSSTSTSSGTLIFAACILFFLTLLAGTLPVMLIECLSKKSRQKQNLNSNNEGNLNVIATSAKANNSNVTEITLKSRRSLSSKLSALFAKDRVVQFLAQLGGGVLLYTALIHMLPEIREDYEHYKAAHPKNESLVSGGDEEHGDSDDLPLVDIFALAGFFAIFLIEEVMHTFLAKGHDHGHGGEEDHATTKKVSAKTNFHQSPNGQNFTRRLSGVKQAYMDHKRIKNHYTAHVNEHDASANGHCCNGNSQTKSNGMLVMKPDMESSQLTSIYQPHRCYDACSDESHCADMAIDSNGIVGKCDVENVSNFSAVIAEDRTIFARILDALVMILAFSCHAVFDGISIGVQSGSRVWTVLIAILTHKLLIAFILSVQIYERCFQKVVKPELENGDVPAQRKPMKRAKPILWVFSTIFALMSPAGIIIVLAFNGNGEAEADKPLHLILLAAFSAGTILYICFLEIIDKSSSRRYISGFVQWLALVIGFGLMHLVSTLFHED